MLLEMENAELIPLLSTKDALDQKVSEALNVLHEFQSKETVEESEEEVEEERPHKRTETNVSTLKASINEANDPPYKSPPQSGIDAHKCKVSKMGVVYAWASTKSLVYRGLEQESEEFCKRCKRLSIKCHWQLVSAGFLGIFGMLTTF